MTLHTRISAGFALVLALAALVGVVGWTSLTRYAEAVDLREAVAEVAAAFDGAVLSATRYEEGGDAASLNEALGGLDTVDTARAALGERLADSDRQVLVERLGEQSGRFRTELSGFAALERDKQAQLASLEQHSEAINKGAIALRGLQKTRYEEAGASLRETEAQRQRRLELMRAASRLIENTLKAREAEAVHRLSLDPAAAERANEHIKGMFLSNLELKKLAKGTEDEPAIAEISKAVTEYRKGFKDLAEALADKAAVDDALARLTESSSQIASRTAELQARQKDAYDAAAEDLSRAQQAFESAVAGSTDALRLVSLCRGLQLAVVGFLADPGAPETRPAVESAFSKVAYMIKRLAGGLEGEAGAAATEGLETTAAAHAETFQALAGTLAEQAEAAQAMRGAREDLLRLIDETNAQISQEMQDSDGFSRTMIVVGSLVAILIGAAMALVIGRSITRPLKALSGTMSRLAASDFEAEVPGRDRNDEIGEMAGALQVFKESGVEMERLRGEREETDRRAREEKNELMQSLADSLDVSVKEIVDSVRTSATEMSEEAKAMSRLANQTKDEAGAVRGASTEASSNVQTVAAAAEELSSSIAEISQQVTKSNEIAASAANQAQRTNEEVEGLVEAAQKIGEVVHLISDIAEQTNLLALNATIEAARAGEAGKGFAVVASEVKSLANQTAKATEEISLQIGNMQTATTGAATVIKTIGTTIAEINEISGAIAAAVEEQSAATGEIARNAELACNGTETVSGSISAVSEAADQTGTSATKVLDDSTQLAQLSIELARELQEMTVTLRQSSVGDRRNEPRQPVNWRGHWSAGERAGDCTLENLSPGGAKLTGDLDCRVGEVLNLTVEGLETPIPATVKSVSEEGASVAFANVAFPESEEVRRPIAALLTRSGYREYAAEQQQEPPAEAEAAAAAAPAAAEPAAAEAA